MSSSRHPTFAVCFGDEQQQRVADEQQQRDRLVVLPRKSTKLAKSSYTSPQLSGPHRPSGSSDTFWSRKCVRVVHFYPNMMKCRRVLYNARSSRGHEFKPGSLPPRTTLLHPALLDIGRNDGNDGKDDNAQGLQQLDLILSASVTRLSSM
ncbi:hypothetical protein C8R44DRAFT_883659 [Mycena epipterygia]|nr:hypothetical protein C8R44DRAFT_883659 [Mycena epipterygia]